MATGTKFSDFIRNATVAEKERVYSEVLRKAVERQTRKVAESKARG